MPPSPPSVGRSIVLVGMMGAGKSTIGRRLAQRLGLPFADADHEIERAAQYTISEIFERFGEPSFRDGERRVIARLMQGAPKVIATGGGAFVNDETRALILDQGFAVWLIADLETLVARVARRDHRPLLQGKDARAVLAELLPAREPFYAQAHLHIRSCECSHEHTVDMILAAIRTRRLPPSHKSFPTDTARLAPEERLFP